MDFIYLSRQDLKCIPVIPSGVKGIELSNNGITKIEENKEQRQQNIYSYNSLKRLELSDNEITKIENLPSGLRSVGVKWNQISLIENLPKHIWSVDLSCNQISTIENLPDSLRELWLDNNRITKIKNLPNNLQTLSLLNNRITKIENLPENLHILYLDNNQITELSLSLLELKQLNKFYYHDNPIENIHPLVQRWLDRRLNRRVNNNNKVYSDRQNIHNSTIQKSFRNSLGNLLKDENTSSLEECKKHVLECNELDEQVKRELLNYCDDETEHSVYLVKFEEVFQYVVSRIIGHSESTEMFKILNEEIKDTICKCFTGRITRLVNVLNGFYDDITIQIGSNEQISNIIVMLQQKYEDEELIIQVRKAMEEREYNNETIEEWLTYIRE